MNTETVAISSLKLDPGNARRHDDKNLAAIRGSLEAFGQQKPLVVSGDTVAAGNGTLLAAQALGWTTVQIVRTELTGADLTAFCLADNRTAELAEWDNGVLTDTLRSLKELDFDIDSIGFADFDLSLPPEEGKTDPDAVPEQVETRCKLGDLWTLGKHRLLCGDSTNVLDVERLMGGEKADMVFTDPPYGLGDTKSFNKDHPDYADDEPFDLKLLQLWDCEYVIWGANYYEWLPAPRTKIGWIVWDKRPSRESWDAETRAAADRRFGQHFEMAVTNVTEARGKLLRRTWGGFYGTAGDVTNKIVHKTQKPIELAEMCLQPRHKTVLDYFLGSGSTLIACEKTGRRCFGMEIDAKYCDVIISRWEQFSGKIAVLTPDSAPNG